MDTTTTGMEAIWNFDDPDDLYSRAVVECVPLQDGECPAPDSPCLAGIMETRDSSNPRPWRSAP